MPAESNLYGLLPRYQAGTPDTILRDFLDDAGTLHVTEHRVPVRSTSAATTLLPSTEIGDEAVYLDARAGGTARLGLRYRRQLHRIVALLRARARDTAQTDDDAAWPDRPATAFLRRHRQRPGPGGPKRRAPKDQLDCLKHPTPLKSSRALYIPEGHDDYGKA
jgi:hypothetical protein